MRKYLLAFVTLISIIIASCQPSKEAYRNDFVKGCVTSYAKDSTVANTEGRKYVEEYCSCVGDIMNSKMSQDEWKTFNRSQDTSLSKFKNEIQPCKDEFHKKVASLKKQ